MSNDLYRSYRDWIYIWSNFYVGDILMTALAWALVLVACIAFDVDVTK